ncbi:MAG: hypothetical protein ACRBDL_03210 [Alphaproteobacteria bacterium]
MRYYILAISFFCFAASFILTKAETYFQDNSYVTEVEAIENRLVPARPYKYLGHKKEVGYVKFIHPKGEWYGHNMLVPLPKGIKKGDVFKVRIRDLPNWESKKPKEIKKIGSSTMTYKHRAFVIVPEGVRHDEELAMFYFMAGLLCLVGAFFASPPSKYRTRFSKGYYAGWVFIYASWAILICSWANLYNIPNIVVAGSYAFAFICYLTTLKEMMDKKTTISDEHMEISTCQLGRAFDYTTHIGTLCAHMFFIYLVIYHPPL